MAFVTKYYTSFRDRYQRTILINLQFDGYSGSSIQLRSKGMEISWNADSDDIYKPIRASVCTMSLYQDTVDRLDEMLAIKQNECRVELKIDAVVYWMGFVLAGNYQRPYKAAPNIVQLMATDGLGMLSGIPYKNSGSLYRGRDTALNILIKLLAKLNLSLGFVERVNVYEDGMDSTTNHSPLKQVYIDQEAFVDEETLEALSCYDVLEKILTPFNAVIYMEQGKWHITRIAELFDSTIWRQINSAGNVVTSGTSDIYNKELSDNDASSTDYLRFINNDAIIKTTLPRASINVNFPLKNQLLLDTSFDNASAISDYYTDSNSIGLLVPVENGTQGLRLEYFNNNYYLEYKTTYHGTTGLTGRNLQYFRVSGQWKTFQQSGLFPPDTPSDVYEPQIILDDGTTKWFASNNSWIDYGLYWPLVPETSIHERQWQSFEKITPEIPDKAGATYEVLIRFYAWQDNEYTYYDDVKVEFLNGLLEVVETLEIDMDNVYGGGYDLEIFFRDSDVVNSQLMAKNAMSLSGEGRAYQWTSKLGSDTKELNLLCQDVYKSQYIRPKITFQGVMVGLFNYSNTMGDGNGRFFGSRVIMRLPECTWDGEWVEIKPGLTDISGTYSNGIAAANEYDIFDSTDNVLGLVKSQTATIAQVSTNATTEVGRRYKIVISVKDYLSSDYPDVIFGGVTNTLANGVNTFEFIATAEQYTSDPFIESAIADTMDFQMTINIYELSGL